MTIRPEGFANNAFMGETAKPPIATLIDNAASKIQTDHVIGTFVAGSKDAIRASIRAVETIHSVWSGVNSVDALQRTLVDTQKTQIQKDRAKQTLDVMGKAVFIVMRFGGNEDWQDALGSGSALEVDNLLPEPLKGLGEQVRSNIIDNDQIVSVMNGLDDIRENCDLNLPRDQKSLRAATEQAYDQLTNIRGLDVEGRRQLKMVKAYLNTELGPPEEAVVSGVKVVQQENTNKPSEAGELSAEQEYFRDLAAYQAEESALRREVAQVSLSEWVDAQVSITAPRERAPQMWEYKPPDWMNGESRKRWRQLLKLSDGMLGGTYQKQEDGGYKTSLEMVKKNSMSLMKLPEEDFKFVQEHEVLNGAGVSHEIFQELMVPQTTSAIIDGNSVTTTTFVFKHTTDRDGKKYYIDKVKLFADNPAEFKRELAQRLVEKKVVANIEAAKLSVALTMDAFEVGGVFSGADFLRKLSWESDAVRLAQRPIDKFNAKLGEMWGGTWNTYCKAVSGGDAKRAAQKAEELGIIPKVLAGSFLDVLKQDGKSWAQKMYDGEEITFNDSSEDLYFVWRKDSLNAACDVMMYITKEKPLQFKSFAEPDNVISDWVSSLYNDIKALRENGVSLLTVENICGAFGGSVGMWPFEGPYFRISALNDPKRHMNYFSVATETARQLGLSPVDEKKFLAFYGVDRKNFTDLNDKMTDYSVVLNPNSSESLKASMYTKGSLLKKRT